MLANVRSKRFLLHVGIDNALKIGKFSIDNLQLDINYQGGPQSEVTGRLLGQMTLAGQKKSAGAGWKVKPLKFSLMAEMLPHGWIFAGSLSGPDVKGIKLSDFINHLTGSFSPSATPPAFFDDLTLRYVSASFNTATRDFEFNCDAAFPKGSRPTLRRASNSRTRTKTTTRGRSADHYWLPIRNSTSSSANTRPPERRTRT